MALEQDKRILDSGVTAGGPVLRAPVLDDKPILRRDALRFHPDDKVTPAGGTAQAPPRPLGRGDFWPDVVYIAKVGTDSFLTSAKVFHETWGFKPVEFTSLEQLIGLIAKAKKPDMRVRVACHAIDGFLIPLFEGSPSGFFVTQKQIEALNTNDGVLMDEMLGRIVDLNQATGGGVVFWNALLVKIEEDSPDALKPFKYDSKTKPTGDLDLLLRRCADLIAVQQADPALTTAIRKSMAACTGRLKRSQAETDALEAAVKAAGFPVAATVPQEVVDRVSAAVAALDKRTFRKTIKDAQDRLKGKWLDFRGCRIGGFPAFLQAFAVLLGTDGCTAPDWWMGFPGTAIHDKQVAAEASFRTMVTASPEMAAEMNRWGARMVSGWANGASDRFFNEFLVAQDGMFADYEVKQDGATLLEKHMLFWASSKAKKRWLEAMWDRAPAKIVDQVARGWGTSTPRIPTVAQELVLTSTSQRIFVCPEPEYRDHIKEVKKP